MRAFLLLLLFLQSGCALGRRLIIRVPFFAERNVGPATFSPNGQEIVFTAETRKGKASHVYKSKIDGTGLVALTTGAAYAYGPVFSPSGDRIYFSQRVGDEKSGDLYWMRSDGSGVTQLTSGPEQDFGPIVSPDGKKIYFIRAQWFGNASPIAMPSWKKMDVFSVGSDGKDLKKMTDLNDYRLSNLSISADGRRLFMQRFNRGQDMWTVSLDEHPSSLKSLQPDLSVYKEKKSGFFSKLFPSEDTEEFSSPQISPSAEKLVFLWSRNSSLDDLYVLNMLSGEVQRLTEMNEYMYWPRISSDGKKIIFKTFGYYEPSKIFSSNIRMDILWTVGIDGQGLQRIDFKETREYFKDGVLR